MRRIGSRWPFSRLASLSSSMGPNPTFVVRLASPENGSPRLRSSATGLRITFQVEEPIEDSTGPLVEAYFTEADRSAHWRFWDDETQIASLFLTIGNLESGVTVMNLRYDHGLGCVLDRDGAGGNASVAMPDDYCLGPSALPLDELAPGFYISFASAQNLAGQSTSGGGTVFAVRGNTP